MRADVGAAFRGEPVIRVDGGMTASDWTMQFLADMLAAPVDRPTVQETTALGVAFLAGWRAGLFGGPEDFSKTWQLQHRFQPTMAADERERRFGGWSDAVARSLLKREPLKG
jgi:glycerol kinase